MDPDIFTNMVNETRSSGEVLINVAAWGFVSLFLGIIFMLKGAKLKDKNEKTVFSIYMTIGILFLVTSFTVILVCGIIGFQNKYTPVKKTIQSQTFRDAIIGPISQQVTQDVIQSITGKVLQEE